MYPFWLWSRGLTFTQRLQFLVGGQSNASGRGVINALAARGDASTFVFGNDYVWRRAEEPIDDPTNQVDTVSADTGSATGLPCRQCWGLFRRGAGSI